MASPVMRAVATTHPRLVKLLHLPTLFSPTTWYNEPMKIFLHWFVSAITIGIAAYLVPGATVTLTGALILAVVLAALNLLIRPVLFALTLPITILTLGLFSLVINALLVLLAATLVPGFSVTGFWSALLFALALSIINWVFSIWEKKS